MLMVDTVTRRRKAVSTREHLVTGRQTAVDGTTQRNQYRRSTTVYQRLVEQQPLRPPAVQKREGCGSTCFGRLIVYPCIVFPNCGKRLPDRGKRGSLQFNRSYSVICLRGTAPKLFYPKIIWERKVTGRNHQRRCSNLLFILIHTL